MQKLTVFTTKLIYDIIKILKNREKLKKGNRFLITTHGKALPTFGVIPVNLFS